MENKTISDRMKSKKVVIPLAIVVVLILLGGAAIYWFVIRDTAPDAFEADGTIACATGEAPDAIDGTWTIQGGDCESQAGLRIEEEFTGGVSHTAVGRTTAVTGSFEIAGTEITTADFTVDLAALEYTDSPPGLDVANRANAMKDVGLQTTEFPEASFALTAPITLAAAPEAGAEVTTSVTGELTLHGVTKEITFDVTSVQSGDAIQLTTATPVTIVLADYEIDEPKVGPVASVAPEGSFEFQVVLKQA